jgi:hypothetical protein
VIFPIPPEGLDGRKAGCVPASLPIGTQRGDAPVSGRPSPQPTQLTIDDELETWEEWFASLPPIQPAKAENEEESA